MKIGIITHFYNSTNYGGVLQAYALCRHLNNRGHEASQILYTNKNAKISASSMTLKTFLNKVVNRVERKFYRKRDLQIKRGRENAFFEFRNGVPHTKAVYTGNTIDQVKTEFDAFITGSDQVWNPIWHDPAYFLNFADKSVITLSYAASIGVGSLDDLQADMFRKYLTTFDAISVREQRAAELLSPLTRNPVCVSVDPTLLLNADEWDEIASERKIEEPYVFLYALGNDMRIRKSAEKFAKRKSLKLVMISDLMGTYRREDRKIRAHSLSDATPNDFVSLIKYADYVFTDSFHACVFSLLYKREFFAFARSGGIKMESRIQNLLETFGCRERFCIEAESTNADHLLSIKPIDYAEEPASFAEAKQRSINYLESNLR